MPKSSRRAEPRAITRCSPVICHSPHRWRAAKRRLFSTQIRVEKSLAFSRYAAKAQDAIFIGENLAGVGAFVVSRKYSRFSPYEHAAQKNNRAMEGFCYYSVLGVDVNAGTAQIAAAYSTALEHFRQCLASGNPHPIERLDAIRQAYRTLIDPKLRQIYDRRRAQSAMAVAAGNIPADFVAADSPSTVAAPETRLEFRGSGDEYFRIWLVNIALTLVTLGIYSAWAKVRRERYFHRNMIVDSSAFDYHGKPRAILLGRMVLMLFFFLASIAENFGHTAKLLVLLVGAGGFPWLIVQSMRFRARNTSYRGIRFSFSGKYLDALLLFLVHGGLCLLSIGLYFPAFLQRQKAFVANHLSYGNTPVVFSAGVGAFYRALLFPLIVWCLLLTGVIGMLLVVQTGGKSAVFVWLLLYGFLLFGLLTVFIQLILSPYARVVGTNLLWNALSVGGTRFRSTQKVRSYLAMALGNWALTLLTLGFFWPLGQIRLASFRARNLIVSASQHLGKVSASAPGETAALGSETLAAIDLDIAL